MGKYGDTAIRVTELLREGYGSAEDAWRDVAEKVFANAPDARKKGCPRETFLGLCQAGLIAGVPASSCRKEDSRQNRLYAVMAVKLLKANPSLADGSKAELWRRVMKESGEDPNKEPNRQMEVVLALWANGLINTSAVPEG